MSELLNQTFSDASAFWAAIEALATIGALILVLWQLPKVKRELSSHKVEGLRFAREVLQSAEFAAAFEVIRDKWKDGGSEYPKEADGFIATAFSRLDLLAKLISEGYIDQRLLLYEFGDDLYLLERFATSFEHREDSKMPAIKGKFPGAYGLLKDAARYSRRETDGAFRRQRRFQRTVR
jgi:hypothetical protein